MISIQVSSPRRLSVSILLTASLVTMLCLTPDAAAHVKSPAGPVSVGSPAQEVSPEQSGNQSITLLLSPTSQNVFNFGPHSFKVQYPAGTNFSGVDMTVTAIQLSQSAFSQRVAGTQFSKAICVVYSGETGNCIDYEVTCSNLTHQAIKCPTTTSSYISVWTSFDTGQPITNPGFLTTPIGTNSWQNILDSFFITRIDPTAHGHTKGFSEFVVVALGTTNPEGLGEFTFNPPLQALESKSFPAGQVIPVSFHLVSVVHCGQPVTDAVASLSVRMVADSLGQATSQIVYVKQNAFTYLGGNYEFSLSTASFAAGTYVLTVYGDAFISQETYFTIQ